MTREKINTEKAKGLNTKRHIWNNLRWTTIAVMSYKINFLFCFVLFLFFHLLITGVFLSFNTHFIEISCRHVLNYDSHVD